jgi:hypothetical protein
MKPFKRYSLLLFIASLGFGSSQSSMASPKIPVSSSTLSSGVARPDPDGGDHPHLNGVIYDRPGMDPDGGGHPN